MDQKTGIHYIKNEIRALLGLLNEDQYCRELSVLGNISLGKHLRHVYEFYQIIAESNDSFVINYSERKRNLHFELSLTYASKALDEVFDILAEIDPKIQVTILTDPVSMSEVPTVSSSYGREMMYAFDHAIHHLAIIKIGAKSMGVELPSSFGVAPSTLLFQNQ